MTFEQAALTAAAMLLAVTMAVHSVVGQRRLVRPLLDEGHGLMQRPLARFILPFAWHLTSFIGLIVATVLFAFAWAPGAAPTVGMAATTIVFTVAGIWDAFGSKGRHVGWIPLTLIGLAALTALIVG